MDERVLPISTITSETRSWSARVRVVTKLPVKTAISSPMKYQKMILGDESGDTIEAIIFKSDVDLYTNSLEESKSYKVSNAQVTKVNENYRNALISSPFQWIINSRTSVIPLDEDVIPAATIQPDFLVFNKFSSFLGTKKLISTICVILEKRTPRRVLAKGQYQLLHDYAAIDKQMIPFVLTFWGDIVSNVMYSILDSTHKRPVIALMNFIVTGYFGMSLSSTPASIVLDRMENESFAEIRSWRTQAKLLLDAVAETAVFFEESMDMKISTTMPASTILEVLQAKELGMFKIDARGCIDNESQNFVYRCCEDCRRGINVAYNYLFKCNRCGTDKIAKPRFRFRLTVFDHTGTLEVTLFGKQAEKILGMPAYQFYEQLTNSGVPPISSVNPRMEGVTMCMIIKSGHFHGKNGKEITVYNLESVEFVGRTAASPLLLTPSTTKNTPAAIENTPQKEASDKPPKRKLYFGSSNQQPPTDVSGPSLDSVSMKRHLVKMGKAKVIEGKEVTDSGDINVFDEPTPHSSNSSDNDSLDELLTLSDLVRTHKPCRKSMTDCQWERKSNNPEDCIDTEPKTRKGADKPPKRKLDFGISHEHPPIAAPDSVSMKRHLKMGKAKVIEGKEVTDSDINSLEEPTPHSSDSSDNDSLEDLLTLSDMGKKKQLTRKSSMHVVLDDDSSEDEVNVGQNLARQELPMEDTTEDISKLKRSTRGRIIKPKKYD